MNIIETTQAPGAIGPYSQGIHAQGLIFFSGQIALTPDGNFIDEDVEAQTHQIFKNIDALLNAAQITKQDVVKATVYLKDMNDFDRVNRLYSAYFENHKPARSCIGVSELPKSAKIEIEIIAQKD